MRWNPTDIPKPETPADYHACYSANLDESRRELEIATNRFRALKRAQQITERPEGGFVFSSPEAAKAYGDMVRHRSDLEHWHTRKIEMEREMAKADRRLPVEAEEEVPF